MLPSGWKWKCWTVILATIVGIYLLIPTFCHFNTTWDQVSAKEIEAPWYLNLFPKKFINLGLDLQGGIYVEMQVDIADAVAHQIDLLVTDTEKLLNDEKLPFTSVIRDAHTGIVNVTWKPDSDISKAIDLIERRIGDNYRGAALQRVESKENDGAMMTSFALQDNYRQKLESSIVNQALETVRNRIDRYGVAETEIRLQGNDRIAIELPGLKDPEQAMSVIQQTGQLSFHLVDDSMDSEKLSPIIASVRQEFNIPENASNEATQELNNHLAGKIPANTMVAFEVRRDPITKKIISSSPYLVSQKAELTGDMLENASVQIQDNEPHVNLSFNKRGTSLFADLTKANVGRRLAIMLDGYVNTAPSIREPILQGQARITLGIGDYASMVKEAEVLALVLQEGALPAKLTEATKTVVGPTLGQDSIKKGLNACLFGALVVVLFMMVYYKLSGFFANVALAVNMVLLLAILSLFEATLTLPGIAGIALTLGMAVDANVIINERIREELAAGKSVKLAVQLGYANASRAIIDSNLTTLIAGIVLYQFGTGPVRGFAVTLSIGILTTLFTAIVVTRLIYDYLLSKRNVQTLSI